MSNINNSKFLPDSATALKLMETIDKSGIISITNTKGIITYANPNFCTLFGYSQEELIGNTHNIIKNDDNPTSLYANLWETITNGETYINSILNKNKDGSIIKTKVIISPIVNKETLDIEQYVSTRVDETSEYLSSITDSQTNLPNKEKLNLDIKKSQTNLHLALIDINDFGNVSTYYGQEISKEILKKFAHLLKMNFKENPVYRLYADVFAILDTDDNKTTSTFLKELRFNLENLRKHQNIIVDDIEIHLHFTTAIAKGDKANRIFEKAETALREAKKQNLDMMLYTSYLEPNTKDYAMNKMYTVEFTTALEQNKIIPYFQPIYNNITEKIEKYECLARLIQTDGTPLRPDIFINIAHQIKKYEEVTRIMVKKSFDYFANKKESFSVNISSTDILNPRTNDFIFRQISAFPQPSRIVFELLEDNDLSKDIIAVKEFITKVKALGCQVAIDDFGTGYSNFTTLPQLRVNFLKIDGSIIKDLKNPELYNTAKAIVEMAKGLKLLTIAEFVANQETLDFVKELGIDYSQGYLIGKPEPATI